MEFNHVFDIQNPDVINWIQTNTKHISGFFRYNLFNNIIAINDIIELVTKKHETNYTSKILETHNILSEEESDEVSEEVIQDPVVPLNENEEVLIEFGVEAVLEEREMVKRYYRTQEKQNKVLNTVYNKKTMIHKLHFKTENLKMRYCLEFLKEAGFTSLYQVDSIRINWINLHRYIKDNQLDMKSIFNCSILDLKEEFDTDERQSIMKYVNSKLENIFGIKMKTNSNNTNYIINKLFIPNLV